MEIRPPNHPWGPYSDMGPEVSIPVSPGHYWVLLCPGYKIRPGAQSKSKLPGREGTGERASAPPAVRSLMSGLWVARAEDIKLRRGKGGVSWQGTRGFWWHRLERWKLGLCSDSGRE